MKTSISCGGYAAGEATPAPPVIDEQCPAVRTVSGAISVPVHRKPLAMTTSETEGNSFGPAFVPPTMAIDGEAESASAAHVPASARESLRRRVRCMGAATRARPVSCGQPR